MQLKGDFAKTQNRGTRGKMGMNLFHANTGDGELAALQGDDQVDQFFVCNDHDSVLCITTKGQVLGIRAWQVPIAARTAKGVPLPNLFASLTKNTNIAAVIPVSFAKKEEHDTDYEEDEDDEEEIKEEGSLEENIKKEVEMLEKMIKESLSSPLKYLIMVTKKGTIKKTPLEAFSSVHKRRNGLKGIKVDQEGDEVKWVRLCQGESDSIVLATKTGFASRFSLNDIEIRVLGRSAKGVIAMRLRPGDEIVDIDVLPGIDLKSKHNDKMKRKTDILVITSNGFGKRTKISNYINKHRGGKGFSVIKFKKHLGKEEAHKQDRLACLRACSENDDVLLSTSKGIMVKQRIMKIPRQSKLATGVVIQKLDPGTTISRAAVVPSQEEDVS